MGFVDKHLLPGETVSFRTHLHWKIYIQPLFIALIIGVPASIWLFNTDRKPFIAIPVALAAVLLLVAHMQRMGSEFAVTNKRVIFKTGVGSTHSIELLLSKVEAIAVNQTVMGRMLGYGEIDVTGSGGTRETFASIQSPYDFRSAVQAATDPGK